MTGTLQLPVRVKQTSTTTGTGTLNLIAPPAYLLPFSSRYASGAKVAYLMTDNASNYEYGMGTLTTGSPDTLSRDTIIASSNANAAVNWPAGTRDLFVYSPTSFSQIGFTANTTFSEADWGNVYEFTGSGAVVGTLPVANNLPRGWFFVIKNLAAAAGASAANNTLALTCQGADTVDGVASLQLGLGETAFIYKSASGKLRTVCRDGLPLLQSVTVAAASSLVITNLDAAYDIIEIELANLQVSTSGTGFLLRISQDNGATFKAGATDYGYFIMGGNSNSAGVATANSTGDTGIFLATSFGTTASTPSFLRIKAHKLGASVAHAFEFDVTYYDNSGQVHRNSGSGKYNTDANVINALALLPGTGTFSATARVYGRRAA